MFYIKNYNFPILKVSYILICKKYEAYNQEWSQEYGFRPLRLPPGEISYYTEKSAVGKVITN